MFESVKKYYQKNLDMASAEALPMDKDSLKSAMGQVLGGILSSNVISQLPQQAGDALSLIFSSSSPSDFVEKLASVSLPGGRESLSQYSSIALSPIVNMLTMDPDVAMFSLAGHVANAGQDSAASLSGIASEMMSLIESSSAHFEVAANSSGSWAASSPAGSGKQQFQSIMADIASASDSIATEIENGNGLSYYDLNSLREKISEARNISRGDGSTTSVAATKVAMDRFSELSGKLIEASSGVNSIKAGFSSMTNTENLSPSGNSGSLYVEHSKIMKGVSAKATEILGRVSNTSTPDEILESLPSLVSDLELCGSIVDADLGAVNISLPSGASPEVLAASAAHINAVGLLNAIGDIDTDVLSSSVEVMKSAMSSALSNGDFSGFAQAASSIMSQIQDVQSKVSSIAGALNSFSPSAIQSSLMDKIVGNSKTNGMDKIASSLLQGKIGSSLFSIDESSTTDMDDAISELKTSASGITDNNQKRAVDQIVSRLVDAKRKHVYAAITLEDSRDKARNAIKTLEEQQNAELGFLEDMFKE